MREVFKGWRRKAGCVALLMACMFFGVWIRGLKIGDEFVWRFLQRHHKLLFEKETITWVSYDDEGRSTFFYYNMFDCRSLNEIDLASKLIEAYDDWEESGLRPRCWRVRLTVLFIPLTLLSAYLLLWKPRKSVAASPPQS